VSTEGERSAIAVAIAVLIFPVTTSAKPLGHAANHHYRHHLECHSLECVRYANAAYNRHKLKEKRRREARERKEAREAQRTMSALEACIIRNESGGNPNAVNGQYEGIGQWSPSSWDHWSHGRYGATPLDATYAEQEKVLHGEGASGMIREQGVYDGCA
jgi:hypothetical protein